MCSEHKRGPKPHAKHVLQWWNKATEEQRREGMHWYWKAHYLAKQMALANGQSLEAAAGVLAVLSPGSKWARNVLEAQHLLSGKAVRHVAYPPNVVKARAIKLGKHADRVVGGPKVTAFYRLIVNPRDAQTVCIDRHAVRICTNHAWESALQASQWLKKEYDNCAQAYRVAAQQLGVLPWQVQAVTWETFRSQPKGKVRRIEILF